MLKRLLTNRNRASLTGIVVRSKGFEGKVMISLETRHLHNFLSLGKVESWSRKPGNKVGDFIRSFSIGTYEIRKSKSVELFIIKWVGGKVIRAEKQRSFMETFFPLLKRGNDERLLARILARSGGNLAWNKTRPRKLWIRVFDYFVPLQSIFSCSKLLTAPGPQHLISARLRAVQHSVNFASQPHANKNSETSLSRKFLISLSLSF